ncbi:MAG: hypothetical protein H8D47_00285 [Planctomycetes bacterium]|nr:hypothetical protein [Planctomycetota bacterium]MBL7107392.1 hypothetical protein [Phycisphaerae bacterium]
MTDKPSKEIKLEQLEALIDQFKSIDKSRGFNKAPKLPADKIQKSPIPSNYGSNSLNDTLDYLRILVKYAVYDLEATRRENTYLKKILNNRKRRR